MSGRALEITQRQIRALCEGARKAGFAPILKLRTATILLVPEERALEELDRQKVDDNEVAGL